MGRRISSESNHQYLIHPVVSFSLLVAGIAAIIIITAALCGARSRKSNSQPKKSSSSTHEEQEKAKTEPTTTTMASAPKFDDEISTENEAQKVLEQQPQPPIPTSTTTKWKEFSSQKFLTLSSASKRKLSSTLSMRLPGAMSVRYRDGKDEQQKQKQKHFKPEDSIWTKTIMLGEKCRVPTEEDDAIIYDQKGNRLTSYPSRVPRSLPVSRSNSFVNRDSINPSFEESKFSTANQ